MQRISGLGKARAACHMHDCCFAVAFMQNVCHGSKEQLTLSDTVPLSTSSPASQWHALVSARLSAAGREHVFVGMREQVLEHAKDRLQLRLQMLSETARADHKLRIAFRNERAEVSTWHGQEERHSTCCAAPHTTAQSSRDAPSQPVTRFA